MSKKKIFAFPMGQGSTLSQNRGILGATKKLLYWSFCAVYKLTTFPLFQTFVAVNNIFHNPSPLHKIQSLLKLSYKCRLGFDPNPHSLSIYHPLCFRFMHTLNEILQRFWNHRKWQRLISDGFWKYFQIWRMSDGIIKILTFFY